MLESVNTQFKLIQVLKENRITHEGNRGARSAWTTRCRKNTSMPDPVPCPARDPQPTTNTSVTPEICYSELEENVRIIQTSTKKREREREEIPTQIQPMIAKNK